MENTNNSPNLIPTFYRINDGFKSTLIDFLNYNKNKNIRFFHEDENVMETIVFYASAWQLINNVEFLREQEINVIIGFCGKIPAENSLQIIGACNLQSGNISAFDENKNPIVFN